MEHLASIFILTLLAIVFLQSGIDKIIDWKGNLSWLESHFSQTVLKGMVPFSLFLILILEIASGVTAIIGGIMLWCKNDSCWAMRSGILSAITFLLLFMGQRLAKDYPGAQSIVIYLIPTLFLIYILQ